MLYCLLWGIIAVVILKNKNKNMEFNNPAGKPAKGLNWKVLSLVVLVLAGVGGALFYFVSPSGGGHEGPPSLDINLSGSLQGSAQDKRKAFFDEQYKPSNDHKDAFDDCKDAFEDAEIKAITIRRDVGYYTLDPKIFDVLEIDEDAASVEEVIGCINPGVKNMWIGTYNTDGSYESDGEFVGYSTDLRGGATEVDEDDRIFKANEGVIILANEPTTAYGLIESKAKGAFNKSDRELLPGWTLISLNKDTIDTVLAELKFKNDGDEVIQAWGFDHKKDNVFKKVDLEDDDEFQSYLVWLEVGNADGVNVNSGGDDDDELTDTEKIQASMAAAACTAIDQGAWIHLDSEAYLAMFRDEFESLNGGAMTDDEFEDVKNYVEDNNEEVITPAFFTEVHKCVPYLEESHSEEAGAAFGLAICEFADDLSDLEGADGSDMSVAFINEVKKKLVSYGFDIENDESVSDVLNDIEDEEAYTAALTAVLSSCLTEEQLDGLVGNLIDGPAEEEGGEGDPELSVSLVSSEAVVVPQGAVNYEVAEFNVLSDTATDLRRVILKKSGMGPMNDIAQISLTIDESPAIVGSKNGLDKFVFNFPQPYFSLEADEIHALKVMVSFSENANVGSVHQFELADAESLLSGKDLQFSNDFPLKGKSIVIASAYEAFAADFVTAFCSVVDGGDFVVGGDISSGSDEYKAAFLVAFNDLGYAYASYAAFEDAMEIYEGQWQDDEDRQAEFAACEDDALAEALAALPQVNLVANDDNIDQNVGWPQHAKKLMGFEIIVSKDISLKKLTIANLGTAPVAALENIKLFVSIDDGGGDADEFDVLLSGNGELVIDFSEQQLLLSSGLKYTFKLQADLTGVDRPEGGMTYLFSLKNPAYLDFSEQVHYLDDVSFPIQADEAVTLADPA